jgi:PIN domain nuclease of toxin-antitoxin system
MSRVVLDASALIAMLKNEPGADAVAATIASASMGVFNYAEVVSHFIHLGMPAVEVDDMLNPLPMTIIPADKLLARDAGRLRTATASAGLSLGDRFCLALAKREGVPAWTADKAWASVVDATSVETVIIR